MSRVGIIVVGVDITYLAYCDTALFNGDFFIDGLNSFDQISWNTRYFKLIDLCNSNPTGTDEFPLSFPEISFFNYRNDFDVNFYSVTSSGFSIDGYLTDITVIPEPTSIILLLLGTVVPWRRLSRVDIRRVGLTPRVFWQSL